MTVFAASVFLSSLLLFLVQPILAKTLLPWFGGAAGVWVASMLFFQAALLLGYSYAHWTTRLLSPRIQSAVHAGLLVASLAFLPVEPRQPWAPGGRAPELQILWLLAGSIGLPFLLLSATGPLVQVWHSRRFIGGFPYRLFAVSNAACLAALLSYPFLIEPSWTLSGQLSIWSAGYSCFALLVAGLALRSGRRPAPAAESQPASLARRALWIALAAVPSSLWLAVGDQLSLSLAAVPLLWILPLSAYLLSFVLCFHRDGWYNPRWMRWLVPLAILCLIVGVKQHAWGMKLVFGGALLLIGLFLCCVFCHGELARRRPGPQGLTSFYLMVALGGVTGAAFVSLAAPIIFNDYLELPVAVSACVLLAVVLLYGFSSPRQVLRMTAAVLAAFVFSFLFEGGNTLRERNFYGVLEVREQGRGEDAYRALYNGAILHGLQFVSESRSRQATTYYSPATGVGKAIERIPPAGRRIGVVGLGVGTLAVYGKEGDYFRFYEINPLVTRLAHSHFSFLRESKGTIEIVPGDARLALELESPQEFDLLVLDAFCGDAIPLHLLTREAFELYLRHLKPEGILAAHVSSKHLDLTPAVLRIAASLGRGGEVVENVSDTSQQVMASTWVLISGARPPVAGKVWTDKYSNLLEVLK